MTKFSEDRGRLAVARVLRYGSLVSTFGVALGLVLALIQGSPSFPSTDPRIHPAVILSGAARLDPPSLIELGVLLLLLTPIFRIVVASVTFALEREWKFVLISFGVLAVVFLSIAFAR